MTTHEAKRLVKAKLDELGATYTKVSAQSVDFSDLARDMACIVTVKQCHPANGDWTPLHRWQETKHKSYVLRFS